MTEDVPFYVDLAKEAEARWSSSPSGTGGWRYPSRSRRPGRVIGWDTSSAMLAQARVRAEQVGAQLELHERDMRDFELDEPAALVYCPYRALLHLPTWHDKRRVFERVAEALAPGGRFAWNAFCFDHAIAAKLDGEHQEEPVPHSMRYVAADNRIDIEQDAGGRDLALVGDEGRNGKG